MDVAFCCAFEVVRLRTEEEGTRNAIINDRAYYLGIEKYFVILVECRKKFLLTDSAGSLSCPV